MLQNVSAQIETYKKSEPLPQAKIFKTAYSGNYDVILLIDQVAKYSIDNRVTSAMVKVGSKYKIRSYRLKNSPYTWIDHGDSNCNMGVNVSLKAFTDKIMVSINMKPNAAEDVTAKVNSGNRDLIAVYNRLLAELEEQRQKTSRIINEINALEKQLHKKEVSYPSLANLNQNNR